MNRTLGSAVAALSVFSAASSLAPAAASAADAVFVLASNQNGTPVLDPIRASLVNLADKLIYDCLVEQAEDQSFHPHLATAWEVTPDGMQWTFHLKAGVTFHDGEVFDAETIRWWVPKFAGTENAYLVEAIDKVEVVDPLTVRFVMKHPDANLLYNLSSGFMGVPAPKAYDAAGTDYGTKVAVGSGPYELEKFATGVETVLTRNPAYRWASALSKNQGAAAFEKLTLREIGDPATAFLEMRTGGVDLVVDVPPAVVARYQTLANVKMTSMPGFGIFYMPINTTVEPFTDVKVRRATALAIDRKQIVDNLYAGKGAAATTFLLASLPEAKVDPKLQLTYDPKAAAALLDEAGWKLGADGVRVKDGKPLVVTLWTQSDTEFKRMTEVVQAQLKAIGMKAEIAVFDTSAIRAEYKKGKQQLAVRSYGWNNADILDWFFSGERIGYPNISMWKDPAAEELRIKALKGSRTLDERIANFRAYHEYVLAQVPFAPIYEPVQTIAFNADRLTLPATIRGPQFSAATVMDIAVK
ncbi:ABC transporter substrate-binding protein [Siculibacillus lacustris]|uniref:ABC transporter substrate-binding protein n=2 Tax=Siculibacillus lacustris TaxID=1549641 RepID=A0A4V2KTD8_9HYPH|nr:ABC transporter substrate-binding protein [Siculibacillus lacustris]